MRKERKEEERKEKEGKEKRKEKSGEKARFRSESIAVRRNSRVRGRISIISYLCMYMYVCCVFLVWKILISFHLSKWWISLEIDVFTVRIWNRWCSIVG